MPQKKGQFRYGLFVHRGDGRYVWDERIGKMYYRESAAQQAADRMNERGEHGGNVVVRSESWTQHYERRNNPPRVTRQRRTARGRVRGRPLKNSAESDRKPMRAFVISGMRVEWFQGYAEDVRYLRASNGKKYSHVVETDAAELYLCSHPEFGNCLLIVDPSGRTPLWK